MAILPPTAPTTFVFPIPTTMTVTGEEQNQPGTIKTITKITVPQDRAAEFVDDFCQKTGIRRYSIKRNILLVGITAATIFALIPKINAAAAQRKPPTPFANLLSKQNSTAKNMQIIAQTIGQAVLTYIGKHPKTSAAISVGIGSIGYLKTISDTIKQIVNYIKTNPIKCSFIAGGVTVLAGVAGVLFLYNQRHPQQIQNASKELLNEGKKIVEQAGKKIVEQVLPPSSASTQPATKIINGIKTVASFVQEVAKLSAGQFQKNIIRDINLLQENGLEIVATLLPKEAPYETAIKNKDLLRTLQLLCYRAWKVAPRLDLYM